MGRRPSSARPEATSRPMNPPPMTAAVAPRSIDVAADLNLRASENVRSSMASSAPGVDRRRGSAPVASRHRPKRMVSPPASTADRPSGSRVRTAVPVITSIDRRRYQASGSASTRSSGRSRRRSSLLSGGRLYGGRSSSPTSRIEPSKPLRRNARAHRTDATPPPTRRTSTDRSMLRHSRPPRAAGTGRDVRAPGVRVRRSGR